MESVTTTREDIGDVKIMYAPGNISSLHKDLEDPIDGETLSFIRKATLGLCLIISAMGIFTNIVNLHTFIRMSLGDSVTICFFALALADLDNCGLAFAENIAATCENLEQGLSLKFRLSPVVPIMLIEFVRKMFSAMTALITTYVAIQRCLCVLIPFHVRGMFTAFKTYCCLVVFFNLPTVSFGLLIWRHGIVEIPYRGSFNTTQLMLYVRPESQPFFFLADVFLGVMINLACQCIVIVCLIIMFVTLRRSIRFRKKLTTSVTPKTKDGNASEDKDAAQDVATNVKEIQALKQVALISFIFVCTNCPFCGLGMARMLIPEFGLHLAFGNSFFLTAWVMFITEQVNSSVNFFVYFNYNAKFRRLCILNSWH